MVLHSQRMLSREIKPISCESVHDQKPYDSRDKGLEHLENGITFPKNVK